MLCTTCLHPHESNREQRSEVCTSSNVSLSYHPAPATRMLLTLRPTPRLLPGGDTRTTEAGTTEHSSRYGAALQRPLEPATTRARCDPPPTARCPLPASHRPLPTAYDLPCRRSAWPPLRRGGAGEAREGMVSSGRDGCACSPAACARTRSARAPRCSLRPPLRGAAARWRASPPSQKTRARTGWRGGSTLARGRLSLR